MYNSIIKFSKQAYSKNGSPINQTIYKTFYYTITEDIKNKAKRIDNIISYIDFLCKLSPEYNKAVQDYNTETQILRSTASTSIEGYVIDPKSTREIFKDIEKIEETLPQNIEAVAEDIEKQIEEPDSNLHKTINELDRRTNKWINRGYYSSLHIINKNHESYF